MLNCYNKFKVVCTVFHSKMFITVSGSSAGVPIIESRNLDGANQATVITSNAGSKLFGLTIDYYGRLAFLVRSLELIAVLSVENRASATQFCIMLPRKPPLLVRHELPANIVIQLEWHRNTSSPANWSVLSHALLGGLCRKLHLL
jgi:hypothetical protein